MTVYQAPAKLNLSLLVFPPGGDGYHPLHSMVQTVEWLDLLTVEDGGDRDDSITIEGADLDPDDNLVLRALRVGRESMDAAPLRVHLLKRIPIAAGLGGGSSNAAAALIALGDRARARPEDLNGIAVRIGSDVSLFLEGGTLQMTGRGERVERLAPLEGACFAIAVPEFGLSTVEVYRRWDELEGPTGEAVPEIHLPPSLRGGMPMRNDLLPAALDLEPLLGDFMADVRAAWGTSVCLTGSGAACFGYFATLDEAADAARSVEPACRIAMGVAPRDRGVARVDG